MFEDILGEIKSNSVRNSHEITQLTFSQMTINVWNKLSTECVHASSEKKHSSRAAITCND